MYVCSPEKLVEKDFNLKFLNALHQYWHNTKSFQCIGNPKKQNLFLYVEGCKITYTDTNGNVFTAQNGDVVYTPVGSEYKVDFYDFRSDNSHTVGINFLLFDEKGEEIKLTDKIFIFHTDGNPEISGLFHKAPIYDTARPYAQKKILLLEIICQLVASQYKNNAKRIDYVLTGILDHPEENLSVAQMAKMCGMSEVYFRKLFKKQINMSPLQYRNQLRLKRACTYLEYGNISVQEISDTLGYSTVSHFIKEFRTHYGCSPLKYRQSKSIEKRM